MGKILRDDEVKILVCCHNRSVLPEDGYLLPIQVGAAISDADLGYQRDDRLFGEPCDNISDKNKSFCELTGLYWAWKNIKKVYPDIKYVGLNHYRRYFAFGRHVHGGALIWKQLRKVGDYKVNRRALNNLLRKGFSVLVKKWTFNKTVAEQYAGCHFIKDLYAIRDIIAEIFPEYLVSFDEALSKKEGSFCNMFVFSYDDFDSYCSWLFSILFEAERRIDISGYDDFQKRVFGYLAERLLNVWVYHNRLKVKYVFGLLYKEY